MIRILATALAAALAPAVLAGAAPVVPGAPGCTVFPRSNVWNRPVAGLPVHPDSARLVRAIGIGAPLHPDFSRAGGYGIPYQVVGRGTPRRAVAFDYADESDRVRYPIPARPRIERGADRHLLMIDRSRCLLYELYAARRDARGRWRAGSGAVFDLRTNALRPAGWTSADAAGLPILPGLVRHDEVAGAGIHHALRFTAPRTRRAYVYPARHSAGASDSASLPPMGMRVRLRPGVSEAGLGPQARAVVRALKTYGMILADNGSPWFVTGAPLSGWDDDDLHGLRRISGADFEVVDTRRLRSGRP